MEEDDQADPAALSGQQSSLTESSGLKQYLIFLAHLSISI